MWFLDHAWLIPVIPTVSFFLIIFFGKRTARWTNGGSYIGIAALLASFVLAVGTASQWISRVQNGEGGHEGALVALGHSIIPQAEEHTRPFTAPVINSWTWWQSGGVKFTIGTQIDGLAVALLLVVTIISGLVHVYSLEYVRGDRRFTHYYAALSLFTAGMLNLVVAENTIQLLLGWEIMGLCSFMLIGHWWEDKKNSDAALKAFFTTRTGDIGLLVGIVVVFWGARSFSIEDINVWAMSGDWSRSVIFWGALALFIGIIGKSGQFPLHTWLPDAMAGPTPVSALIHAATMVVAGVYLGARLYPVFYQGFKIEDGPINPMALIGGITILIAAVLAFVQVDIKKVLAYSTVSQLGYMVMGLGVGAWTAAVFHIFTHAFFKALLFLGSGSVSHSGSHHSFDMKKDMGGLWRKMPITFVTFIIGTIALMGIPIGAGFFSKDEIIANAGNNGYTAFMVIGLLGAFLTAAYMARCVYLTFLGTYRGGEHGEHEHVPIPERVPALALVGAEPMAEEAGGTFVIAEDDPDEFVSATVLAETGHDPHDAHAAHAAFDASHGTAHAGDHGHEEHHEPHESPLLITVPLIILAVLSLTAGFLNNATSIFTTEKFTEWVEASPLGLSFPEIAHAPFHWSDALLSIGLAALGAVVAYFACVAIYERAMLAGLTRRNKAAAAGYAFLWNKYYLDALYENVIVAGIKGPIAKAAYWFNQAILDAVVNGAGVAARRAGTAAYDFDQKVVDGAVNGTGMAAEGSGQALRPVQSGKVQQYGAILFGAAAIGALILVITV
jgi:NADH-quinone oxidoreductase subunit L